MSKEIMQQALDALDNHNGNYKLTVAECKAINKVCDNLRQALAQPEQEPDCGEAGHHEGRCGNFHCITKPAPPRKEWVGLTEDEVFEFLSDGVAGREDINNIEELLRKKNT